MNIFTCDELCTGKRLDVYLGEKCKLTRSHIKKLIENGNILVNGKVVKAGTLLKLGMQIKVEMPEIKVLKAKPQNIKIDIVYEDHDLAVINKPQGMVVHPAAGNYENTLVNALMFHLKNLSSVNGVIRPGIVHRIDKNTSGLLVVAKNDNAHLNLSNQIKNKTCKRSYKALVVGCFSPLEGEIENYIGVHPKNRLKKAVVLKEKGRYSKTAYKTIEIYKGYSLVEFNLFTGRTHQIRVHSEHLGHPIVGDDLYNRTKCSIKLSGQLLHAYKLEFLHPSTNKLMKVEVPLPNYFKKVLEMLK